MYTVIAFVIAILISTNSATLNKVKTDKFDSYSVFLNYGGQKVSKLVKGNLENAVIKSKVEVLGEVFKKHIDSIKVWPKLDIVFLIDASSSVGEDNFKSELKFVKKLLSDVVVDFDHSRISVVTFSSKDSVITNIDGISKPGKRNNKCLLLNKELSNIRYIGGGTYTVGAFGAAKVTSTTKQSQFTSTYLHRIYFNTAAMIPKRFYF
uniref:VWFA domain-containing protein n=1 Tax=Photinus pyralis TaxID=7054 RepID=A0A1Y1M791_PHOPY